MILVVTASPSSIVDLVVDRSPFVSPLWRRSRRLSLDIVYETRSHPRIISSWEPCRTRTPSPSS
jgi:hypothetical protein